MEKLSGLDGIPDRWRIIDDGEHSGSVNMARDVALALSVADGADPVLRLYRFKPACITLGRFQSINDGIDPRACLKAGIDLARRPTGGLAILHKNDFTYSVSLPSGGTGKSVRDHYFDIIARGIICALESVGIDAEVVRHSGNQKISAWCFEGVIGVDIKHGERKICGSAQKIFDKSVLQHGSLFLDLDPKLYSDLASSSGEREDRQSPVISLTEAGGKNITWDDVREAFERGFSRALDIEMVRSEFSVEEEHAASRLHRNCYGSDDWTRAGKV